RCNPLARRPAERERDRFFSLSADMFCIASFSGHFVRVNPAFCSVLGYEADDLLGMPGLDLIHPDDRHGAVDSARTLATGVHAQRYENRLRCKDGSYKWLGWMVQTPGREHGLVYAVARD